MNRIVLVGRLESTPELRHTSTGIPVANFSLAVRRNIPNGQGRYERDVFRVVTWRKLAETCCRFLERGRLIAVDGKLQNRVLQSPNADRRIIVEIHADDVRFLEGAKPRSETGTRTDAETTEVNGQHDSGEAAEPVMVKADTGATVQQKPGEEQLVVADAVSPTAENPEPGQSQVSVTEDLDSSSENTWYSDETDGTPL